MFDGFSEKRDQQARKRLFASTGTSIGLCLVLGLVIAALAGHQIPRKKSRPVEVSFHRPPPPAKKVPKPPAPKPKPKAAGVKIDSNANANAMIPTAIPKDALAEGNESDFQAQGSIGNVLGTAVGRVGGSGLPGVATDTDDRPVVLPDGAKPPEPFSQNSLPAYPDAARKAGKEGLVVLKVTVTADGRVTDAVVMSGEEPFLTAALAAVKSWHYQPATLDGRAIAVTRLIRFLFA